eukprot:CAMPEP_0183829004 /NCGR_PEP_ID=MMETSP0807_2-20130328/3085_1 /TAXON_ID=88271 /ORGANISM="Picocystis salinarum, Strain CCMP1897" /LENGTH=499 /DNA_ID=CAMNT_0026074211 /DNA_START=505 /DNA_END=2004 /DNA_ORIENTATION=-
MQSTSGEDPRPNSGRGPSRIRVVVRKRPLSDKEIQKKETDVLDVDEPSATVTVHEPKVKVDLTKYVEKHPFPFDQAFDQDATNEYVYDACIGPLVPTIFQGAKATCFAYGQTGSGKTYTMGPLPLRCCQQIFDFIQGRNDLILTISVFEIYGGKIFDLLNKRARLVMREDGKANVCIVGLTEHEVSDVHKVKDIINISSGSRSTGCTGANSDSSRSHAIMQLTLKQVGGRRGSEALGKFSFIDLAGSERGADTYNNDKKTRVEGAEINKSLLALKECIRALDNDSKHIPFRGSKLTEVLRDSFSGDCRTVMIANVSPSDQACENTLNTLRYAYRVRELKNQDPATKKSNSFNRGGVPGVWEDEMDLGKENHPISKTEKNPATPHITSLRDQETVADNNALPSSPPLDEATREEILRNIVEQEEEIISEHKSIVEETMLAMREEMNLLAEVDNPGCVMDDYVLRLDDLLTHRIKRLQQLQSRLHRFNKNVSCDHSRLLTG